MMWAPIAGSGQNMQTVPMLGAPLYDAGYRLPAVRAQLRQTVRNPRYPLYEWGGLHGLGVNAPAILSATAPILSKAASGIISATATQGTMLASAAGPIGAGVAVLVAVIAGLWAAHNARVAGAKAENQAINSAVSTWDQGMRAIFAAANSSDPSQNITGAQAANQVQQLFSQFWAEMSQYMHSPGTADASSMGTNCGNGTLMSPDPCAGTPGGHPCNKSCTATCCVGCADLYPSMLQAVQVLNNPAGGSVKVCTVYGSSYGAQQRSGYTLTYTPPTLPTAAVTATGTGAGGAGTSVLTDLTSSLSSVFGTTTSGGTSSAGSLLPILAVGVLAFLVLR